MTNATEAVAMRHETSDYLQMALFLLFMIVGLPVNISTLFYMLRRYWHAESFLLLLHINLNISDILVLGLYVPGLVGWLITLEWRGGGILCKMMRFADAFVLAFSSNVMVCIALYRLYALRYPLWISTVGHSRVPRMLLLAWSVAAITMLPQLYVWREVDFGSLRQCVTIWTEKINLGSNRTQMTDNDFVLMKLYGIQNACITFYIPLVILVICYVLILKDIYKTLNASESEMASAWYTTDVSKQSTQTKKLLKKERDSGVSVTTRTVRGQDKLSRAKVRSLRITLLLILVYVITWLPNNLLSWWMVISFDSYRDHQDATFPLAFLVVLNSVINPFIYGRCQGLKMMLCCRRMESQQKKVCNLLRS
ncbi:Gonadotropin-releasing hormone II receptor [Trichostrongylus colubriformis]|uniref:Gonadotropin-releasing hormone II receptor n=1 Tax=Trichostrongylus colubriformis TaxID=6319 RepID=A0AAN8FZ52_TRICO